MAIIFQCRKENEVLHEEYKVQCKLVKSSISRSISSFELELAKNSVKNPKGLFTYINDTIQCQVPNVTSLLNVPDQNLHVCSRVPKYLLTKNVKKFKNFIKSDVKQVLLKTNMHRCNNTCLNKYNQCRHKFGKHGKKLLTKSYISKRGKIHLKRLQKFLNNSNREMSLTLRCNHDIQFIAPMDQEGSLSILYYMTNYVAQPPLSTYNAFAIATKAYEKIKEQNLPNNVLDSTKRIMSNMFNILASEIEYSGPQIAHMINSYGIKGNYNLYLYIYLNNLKC